MPTRAQAEKRIVGRCGAYLAKAGLSVAQDGTNDVLTDGFTRAANDIGVALADPMECTDADLAGLATADIDEFLDRAELRTIQTIQRNLARPTIQVKGLMVYNSDLIRHLAQVEPELRRYVERTWGISRGGIGEVTIGLHFAEPLTPDVSAFGGGHGA